LFFHEQKQEEIPMENDRESQIRDRAYALWEQEGRPQGDDLRHWLAALAEFGSESLTEDTIAENTSVLGEPNTAAVAPGKKAAKQNTSVNPATGNKANRKSKGQSSKPVSSNITTGQENARASVKGAEGP
jgi:hypothetical protein